MRLDETTDYQLFFYLLVLAMIGLVVLANVNLANSRFGRAWVAIREDEIAAQAMGIPLLPTKLIAFMTGAAFSGVMGVIYGAQRTFVSPESFTLLASITILAMVILGGMGSIPGAILGRPPSPSSTWTSSRPLASSSAPASPGSRARWTPRSTRGWSSGLSSS